MTREQAVLHHLNQNEERIRYFLKNGDFARADAIIVVQTNCIKLLNTMGYKIIEDPDKAEEVEGYWVMKYIQIEGKW